MKMQALVLKSSITVQGTAGRFLPGVLTTAHNFATVLIDFDSASLSE